MYLKAFIQSLIQIGTVVSEKIQFEFLYVHHLTKFDLAIKYVEVTPGSSFEQTVMGRSPRCYIPSFVKISLPVLVKIFERFFTIYGHGPVTQMPLNPRRLHIKFGFDWPSGFRGEDV